MSHHPDFVSVPSWRSCTAPVHIFSAFLSAHRMTDKHMSVKRGVPRE